MQDTIYHILFKNKITNPNVDFTVKDKSIYSSTLIIKPLNLVQVWKLKSKMTSGRCNCWIQASFDKDL